MPSVNLAKNEFNKLKNITNDDIKILEIYCFYLKYIINDKMESNKLYNRIKFL